MYNIFGLGKPTIKKFYLSTGINIKTYPKKVKKYHRKKLFKNITKKKLGKTLKKYIQDRINFYFEIRSVKGLRHKQGYPIRGQRTHTNAKTKKRLYFLK